ncbi:MAG: DUF4434 domain-containing protein [Bacteroidales bacterium]|nr:DUF4434 domain-containing protein [Bacteroidales bacterium]
MRREFLKKMAAASAVMATAPMLGCSRKEQPTTGTEPDALIVPRGQGLNITGTFLDEISHDIPHQNWGETEWDRDFRYMKAIGIDTVIMIRSGYRKFITYPSAYLMKTRNCYKPSVDLLDMFLRLSARHGMKFYFGLYDSGMYWDTGDLARETEDNRYVIEEVWKHYGHHKSFGGWYISTEISRQTKGAVHAFRSMGQQCKEVSGGLPTLISPWIDGKKAVMAASGQLTKAEAVSVLEHEREWDEIFDGIRGAVDICAFQDGHIDYDELDAFFEVNKKLGDKYGMQCWTNAETFDRDMPIKFLPIKFDKLRMKLEAAKRANYHKAITFEFSHFMSPQSAYLQAGHLYDRYRDYFNLPTL